LEKQFFKLIILLILITTNENRYTVGVVSKLMNMETVFSRCQSSNFSTNSNLRISFLTTKHTYLTYIEEGQHAVVDLLINIHVMQDRSCISPCC